MSTPIALAGSAIVAAAYGLALGTCEVAHAQDVQPILHRNEMEIAELLAPDRLNIDDPLKVFALVFRGLPERATVYPTEHYYYFRLALNGMVYSGNLRLATGDRDRGKLHFAYSALPSDLDPAPRVRYVALDGGHGVTVEKLGALSYRVAYAGKSVVFALNDLSQVRPPAGTVGADERFLGPIFDESAIRFFLVFNTRLKVFHYVLDDSAGVADQFVTAKTSERITIGRRTGFAFYRDDRGRRILIGVLRRNSELNTYFDGPFDQLPDDFIEGDALRDAIVAASPDVKGQIDRFGNFAGGQDRYLIHPFMRYRHEAELAVFHRCITSRRVAAAQRPRCFVIDDQDSMKSNPVPTALKRR